ncbi:MAG: hypothetical protein ACK5NG_04065 [Chthoniobacterales bacterium]
MNLTEEQQQAVRQWITDGVDLSEIQTKLREEFQISITYLEARLLMDDLKLAPKDEESKKDEDAQPISDGEDFQAANEPPGEAELLPDPSKDFSGGSVSVTIDQVVTPGTLVSGKVVFSDGEKADWYLDQSGQLGLNPDTPGYKPAQAALMAFQSELQRVVSSQGGI